jgi:hypothetical protein
LSKKIHQPPKRKGYIPFGLNKLSSSLPLSCIIARLVQVVKVTLGIKSGEHWANMTMPDGSVVELTDLPWDSALWGTKWGTYDVEIYEIEDTHFTNALRNILYC